MVLRHLSFFECCLLACNLYIVVKSLSYCWKNVGKTSKMKKTERDRGRKAEREGERMTQKSLKFFKCSAKWIL